MPTIAELAETLGKAERFSVRAEIGLAPAQLLAGESPEMIAVGRHEGSGNSLILLTDRRLIAMNQTGAFNKRLRVTDIPIGKITAMQTENGRTGTTINVTSLGQSMRLHGVLPLDHAAAIANHLRANL